MATWLIMLLFVALLLILVLRCLRQSTRVGLSSEERRKILELKRRSDRRRKKCDC